MCPNEQHKSDAEKWAGRIITMVLLILIGLAIKLLCEIRAHDQAPMPVMPANYSIVRSPKGASLQIPVMPAPQPPQGVQITVGNAIVPALMFRTNQTNGVRPTLTIAKTP